MHMIDEAGKSRQAERIAGDQFDAVSGQTEGGDGFTCRQAGAFAEQDSRTAIDHAAV
jgi:hypothetical protein